MIITKEPKITDAQLAEIEAIVGDFNCSIQVIQGAHRNIYAIIGDERSQTMVNRLLGLGFVSRVDRIESVYRMMDIKSALKSHRITIGNTTLIDEPIFMAGHCTIDPENPNYFLETAHAVKEAGANVLRGGVWKPRTSPHSFQGTESSMDILLEAKKQTGLPVVAEIMDNEQLEYALKAGLDVIQIGARNALNYSLLRQIGRQTASSGTPVLLKRSIHMGPVDEFVAAAEYIVSNGNPNVMFCPRGTSPKLDGYRNHPDESITPLLKEKSWAPVVVDPSHSVGHSKYVPYAAMSSMSYGADGVIMEAHFEPRKGIGDDPKQAITPDVLKRVISDCKQIWALRKQYDA